MRLGSLTVKNFRALEDVTVEFDGSVNVIVGPNAIGKTTILEAVRFARALLAPRTVSETSQVLVALGASSPHFPQALSFAAIARDVAKPLQINCRYRISDRQLQLVTRLIPQTALSLVQAQLGQAFGGPAAAIQFISSPAGQKALKDAEAALTEYTARLAASPYCRLDVTIEPSGTARGADQFAQVIVASLDRELSPAETIFTYFPADRALPTGEVGVQLGSADAAQQLESHNSQPQIKYGRLKNTIFSTIVQDADGREKIQREFEHIFSRVLKGRRLDSVGVNERGLLSIRVADTLNGRTFEIDGMSSGEKGLILTFLLISTTLAEDGLLLLDEPELHLNPAVCKDVLGFLVSEYITPKHAQAIICTHSPEILASALDRDDCSLFHLRSESSITKVRIHDENEVASALHRLGSSQSESLLYRGTVFVEGIDDVELVELGCEDVLARFKVKDLGGRSEVEKEVRRLQAAELKGDDVPLTLFIFDLDREASALHSTARVRVVQWARCAIENYLLDVDILTDLLTNPEIVRKPLGNMGDVGKLLKGFADAQLSDRAIKDVYVDRRYESPGLRSADLRGKSVAEASDALFTRLVKIQEQVANLSENEWKDEFLADVERRLVELRETWDLRWLEICDGKRVFQEMQAAVSPKMSSLKFKRQVMLQMRLKRREAWLAMENLVRGAVG